MTSSQAGTQWSLSAPESFVLLHGPKKADGAHSFKLGVLELVTRNALAVVHVQESGFLGHRRQTPVLVEGSGGRVGDDRALSAIWGLYQRQPQETLNDGTAGVRVERLARAASQDYRPLGQYVEKEILPALIDRGLYTEPGELQAGGADRPAFELGSFDLGGLDPGGMASLDFSAFDSIGDAFSAIDSMRSIFMAPPRHRSRRRAAPGAGDSRRLALDLARPGWYNAG